MAQEREFSILCNACGGIRCHKVQCKKNLGQLSRALYKLLRDMESDLDMRGRLDVCGDTKFISIVPKEIRRDIFSTWDGWSGSFLFPMKVQGNLEIKSNEHTRSKTIYVGEQRTQRISLVKHIIEYLGLFPCKSVTKV